MIFYTGNLSAPHASKGEEWTESISLFRRVKGTLRKKMANFLNEEITRQVREVFDQLQGPVQVLFFGKQTGCEYCQDTRQLVEEVIPLSDKLGLSVYDLDEDGAVAHQYKVDKAPALVIVGRDGDQLLDYGIRLYGIPAGNEFSTFIHDLILVSGRESGLSQPTQDLLKSLTSPVHLQVFVTPT
jgi:alkyl hydroperoxide reductase subunit AhpF